MFSAVCMCVCGINKTACNTKPHTFSMPNGYSSEMSVGLCLVHVVQKKTGGLPSMWMSSLPHQPAVTLTFDLQNLIRSSVEASEHSLSLLKPFTRCRGLTRCVRINE